MAPSSSTQRTESSCRDLAQRPQHGLRQLPLSPARGTHHQAMRIAVSVFADATLPERVESLSSRPPSAVPLSHQEDDVVDDLLAQSPLTALLHLARGVFREDRPVAHVAAGALVVDPKKLLQGEVPVDRMKR